MPVSYSIVTKLSVDKGVGFTMELFSFSQAISYIFASYFLN